MLNFFLRLIVFSIVLGALSTAYASEGFIVRSGGVYKDTAMKLDFKLCAKDHKIAATGPFRGWKGAVVHADGIFMDPTQVVLISPDGKASMVFHGSLNGQQRPPVWGGSVMRLDQSGKVNTYLATLTKSNNVNCASDPLASASRYGNYTAVFIDKKIVKDVIVQADGIYVQLDRQTCQERLDAGGIRVFKSSQDGLDYSTWSDNNRIKKVSLSNATKKGAKKEYTWRIQTSAKFIEYHVGYDLVLRLKRD